MEDVQRLLRDRGDRGRQRARRHARSLFHVLPSGAVGVVADRTHAARRRRPDDSRDRPRVHGAGGDDGAAAQPREADHPRRRRPVRRARSRTPRSRPARALPRVQRGLHRDVGRRPLARRSIDRGDPRDAHARAAAPRRGRGQEPARVDAAHGCASRGAHGAQRRADPAEGPQAGLAALEAVAADPRMVDSYRVDAARAHLLERAGDRAAAIELFRRAATRTASTPERDYLLLHAARLAES